MKSYHKLVRDMIPKIIQEDGLNYKIRVLSNDEYELALRKKLIEEARELFEATTKAEKIHELADIYEVIEFILKTNNINKNDVEKAKIIKKKQKGSFENKIFLETVN